MTLSLRKRRVSLAGSFPAEVLSAPTLELDWADIDARIQRFYCDSGFAEFLNADQNPGAKVQKAVEVIFRNARSVERVGLAKHALPACSTISYTSLCRPRFRSADYARGRVCLVVIVHPRIVCELELQIYPPLAFLRERGVMEDSLRRYADSISEVTPEDMGPTSEKQRAERQEGVVVQSTQAFLKRPAQEVALAALNGLLAASKRGPQPVSARVLATLLHKKLPEQFPKPEDAARTVESLVSSGLATERKRLSKTRLDNTQAAHGLIRLSAHGVEAVKKMGVPPSSTEPRE